MLLLDGPLTFREFMTHEDVPLASVFRAILTYLRGRPDAVLFGAQAVNAYCEPARMTQDIDLLSADAVGLCGDLREHLAATFHFAARVREVVPGIGFRVYQLRKPKNRHLIDVRQVERLPEHQEIEGVKVVSPAVLVAFKAIGIAERGGREKGLSDRLDLVRLLRTFPDLRGDAGGIALRVQELGGGSAAIDAWREVAATPLEADEDDDDG